MGLFDSKEKKQKKAEAEANAKADLEFEAKFKVKQEKKNVEKIIAEMAKTEEAIIGRAAEAKEKGYTQIYRTLVTQLKVAHARKKQAEVFLFQMDTMQEMQSLSKNTEALLGSMNNIMSSLGKLSLDRTAIMASQKNFAEAQREQQRQSDSIEQALSGLEYMVDDGGDDEQINDEWAENLIATKTLNNAIHSASAPSVSSSSEDEQMEHLKGLLST